MNQDEFWDDLLAHIDEGNVIPVVGPELLTVIENNEPVTFYRLVAQELLSKHGISLSTDAKTGNTDKNRRNTSHNDDAIAVAIASKVATEKEAKSEPLSL